MKFNTTVELARSIETLEEGLELLKIRLFWQTRSESGAQEGESVVMRTAGLLGKRFPSGVAFENEVRQNWRNRRERLGL